MTEVVEKYRKKRYRNFLRAVSKARSRKNWKRKRRPLSAKQIFQQSLCKNMYFDSIQMLVVCATGLMFCHFSSSVRMSKFELLKDDRDGRVK